jgi:hypothetical protein
MARYAELPNGRVLTFNDAATDRQIQREVRKALELTEETQIPELIEELGRISAKLESLLDRDTTKDVAQGLSRLASDTKEAAKTQDKAATEISKALRLQTELTKRMHDVTVGLNSRLEAVMRQSQTSFEDTVAVANNMATTVEKASLRLEIIAGQLAKAVETMQASRRMTKRAYKNRDGSWTMESLPIITAR